MEKVLDVPFTEEAGHMEWQDHRHETYFVAEMRQEISDEGLE